ncbi:general glycosylation pathway protein [Halomonas salinarum]|uniref:general glycosylation pathway protein n=1 Tax=Halomonas salinarum TaxID=1158993 RepID=UPI001ADE3C0F|nr:general glycosylation pathway protein [Halomonas salinarum]
MSKAKNISDWIGRVVYGLISLSLGVISLTMMGVALWDIWLSLHEKTLLIAALLNAIGLIVIGMAVFDVSKFLLEEAVFSSSATKSPEKQRQTLIKFLAIIVIAISLESLVFVFDAGSKDITTLIYPTFLLISAILLVVGLGVYQNLTRDEVT